jgi:anionic cell wall polymer biosynthesis LytR-Cps2A-Psr (LCP) family protein
LKVEIPHRDGTLETAKINAAYSEGGPNLTVKMLKGLFPGLQINHIVDSTSRASPRS